MDNYSTPKKMKQLGELFSKYKNHFKPPQATIEKTAIEIIKKITGFDINTNQITYTPNTRTLNLKIPSVLKSELKIHYPEIIKKLKQELGEKDTPLVIL